MSDVIEFKNGAKYDREKGQIVEGPKTGLFNSETGRAAGLKRWEEKRSAFAEGFAEGIPEDYATLKGDGDAWHAVGKRMAEAIFAESKNPRGLAELVRAAGEFSGWTPNQLDLKQAEPDPNRATVDVKAVTELIKAIKDTAAAQEQQKPVVIDANFTEAV